MATLFAIAKFNGLLHRLFIPCMISAGNVGAAYKGHEQCIIVHALAHIAIQINVHDAPQGISSTVMYKRFGAPANTDVAATIFLLLQNDQ